MTKARSFAKPIDFEGVGLCFYVRKEFRKPKKGEFYLSGAIVSAYRASNDLSSDYWIVEPTHHARRSNAFVRGARVER